MNLPEDIKILKVNVAEVPVPACPIVDSGTKAGQNFPFSAQRTDAGRIPSPCCPCIFLFADPPGSENHGRLEGHTGMSGAVA